MVITVRVEAAPPGAPRWGRDRGHRRGRRPRPADSPLALGARADGAVLPPDELSTARSRGSAALSLAARFAAKEALGKALGTGLGGVRLSDIRVINNHNGRPDMELYGSALARFGALGATLHLSLTHERDNAIAMVVMEA